MVRIWISCQDTYARTGSNFQICMLNVHTIYMVRIWIFDQNSNTHTSSFLILDVATCIYIHWIFKWSHIEPLLKNQPFNQGFYPFSCNIDAICKCLKNQPFNQGLYQIIASKFISINFLVTWMPYVNVLEINHSTRVYIKLLHLCLFLSIFL